MRVRAQCAGGPPLTYPTRSFLRRNASISANKPLRAAPRTVPKRRAKLITKAARLARISNACLAPKTWLAQPLRISSVSGEGGAVPTLPDRFVVLGSYFGDDARGGCGGNAFDGVVPRAGLREQVQPRELSCSLRRSFQKYANTSDVFQAFLFFKMEDDQHCFVTTL